MQPVSAILQERRSDAKVSKSEPELFAVRFGIEGTPVMPSGTYDIRSDDTGTWIKDTEDNDT